MWPSFQVRVPGKWVLTGEHSVLRGASAIALPHVDYGLSLSFEPDELSDSLMIQPASATSVVLEILRSVEPSFALPSGIIRIESSIPIGAGFGSSAALCVAITRWLAGPLGIQEDQILSFATSLEHQFHGKSSGMDIAVIAVGKPISFSMEKGPGSLDIRAIPRFTFHDTDVRARTRECIEQVQEQGRSQPVLGLRNDERMGAASRIAVEGLIHYDEGRRAQGLELIQSAMRQAQECFYSWGLVPPEAKKLENELLSQGALAVKMTGAGGGGMMVALWDY